MNITPRDSTLTTFQRIVISIFVVILSFFIFVFRNGFESQAPLDQLARRSLDPEAALTNRRPTIFEFYADWCEVCREMAPSMLSIEKKMSSQVDIVLLNVDNPRWENLIDKYSVVGIPQLNFFNSNGDEIGRLLGIRSEHEIQQLVQSLVDKNDISELIKLSTQKNYSDSFPQMKLTDEKNVGPRSHSNLS